MGGPAARGVHALVSEHGDAHLVRVRVTVRVRVRVRVRVTVRVRVRSCRVPMALSLLAMA